MRKTRILVVDDAVVVRRMLSEILTEEPGNEVIPAANGRFALTKIPQYNPDLVILDVEMPEMDGLETLAAIRTSWPRLPVVMFSTRTRRGAAATLDALSMGANDYVAKPENSNSMDEARRCIREELLPKIHLYCPDASPAPFPRSTPPVKPATSTPISVPRPDRAASRSRIDVLAIGVSTGGPNALAELLPTLPADFPVPVVIVQHMPPVFTRLLAERLAAKCHISVDEGVPGASLQPGKIWLAPGDYHMYLESEGTTTRLRMNQEPHENSCRPAVDVLFRSVSRLFGPRALGVILTGMGQDGLRGCEQLREAGGTILVQDEASSVVWGMPGFVARAGLADRILPLAEIGPEIVRRVCENRPMRHGASAAIMSVPPR